MNNDAKVRQLQSIWPGLSKLITGFVAPAVIAWLTAYSTLQSQIDEGQTVLDSIGYRYFAALAGAYVLPNNSAVPLASDDPEVWEGYREIISDIREDIRWLRTNPLYGEMQQNTSALIFAQNLLAAESVRKSKAADKRSLHFMCDLYVTQSGLWRTPIEDPVAEDIQTFAKRLCALQAQSAVDSG